jgi:hypothetical protein
MKQEVRSQESEVRMKTTSMDAPAAKTSGAMFNWIATVVFFVGICNTSWASTYFVGAPNTPCPGANFSTIGAALNVALAGDTIEVCPATYPEQVVITKPVNLVGIAWNGVGRAVIQPTTLTANSLGFIAVVTVANTGGVTISNLAIDASNNTATGCTVSLSGIHFYNSSGSVLNSSISGTQLPTPTSCTTLFPGNGAGIQADQSGTGGSYTITVQGNSIHDFSRNGVLSDSSSSRRVPASRLRRGRPRRSVSWISSLTRLEGNGPDVEASCLSSLYRR